MKVTKQKSLNRASTIITTEIDDAEMLSNFQSVEVYRQMIDKSSDKLLEEFMPELRTKFMEEMERITKQMGQEVMVKGLKQLAKEEK